MGHRLRAIGWYFLVDKARIGTCFRVLFGYSDRNHMLTAVYSYAILMLSQKK